jgi:hypothetical protein
MVAEGVHRRRAEQDFAPASSRGVPCDPFGHRGNIVRTGDVPLDPGLAEEISIEALALLNYFARAGEPIIMPDIVDTSVPLPAMQAVLREVEEARSEAEEARRREVETRARQRPVQRAQRAMGWSAVVLALAVSIVVVALKLLAVLDVVPLVALVATCFTAVFLAMAAVLMRLGLYPDDPDDPLRRVVSGVRRGFGAVVRRATGGSGDDGTTPTP